jgi:hypothetical protein
VELAAWATCSTRSSWSKRALVVVIDLPVRSTVTSMSTGPGRGTEANWVAKLRSGREGSSTAAVMALTTTAAV